MRGHYNIQPPYPQPVYLPLYNLFADDGYLQPLGFLHDEPLHGPSVDTGDEEGRARVELVPLNQDWQTHHLHWVPVARSR